MSQLTSQRTDEEAKQVLVASVHDVRYLAMLLRGINFSNRASVILSASGGISVAVEEARTLLATSYIYPEHFDEWDCNPDVHRDPSSQSSELSKDANSATSAFEIPLNTLIECLNIFGTAGISSASAGTKYKKWKRAEDGSDHDGDDGDGPNRQRPGANVPLHNRIDQYFGGGEKRTSMTMSYAGPGYPLTLLLAEDSTGPTTTCEITTFDSEPNIELPFDADQLVLKIIFKSSSWLRDALSELDPSCDKLTFIANPAADVRRGPRLGRAQEKPLFRIQASGTFGSTEMDYPNDREVLETFECAHPLTVSYRFSHISRTLRALQSSTKTSLRIEEEGLLSLQFLVPVPKPRGGLSNSFIEFRCLVLDEETS